MLGSELSLPLRAKGLATTALRATLAVALMMKALGWDGTGLDPDGRTQCYEQLRLGIRIKGGMGNSGRATEFGLRQGVKTEERNEKLGKMKKRSGCRWQMQLARCASPRPVALQVPCVQQITRPGCRWHLLWLVLVLVGLRYRLCEAPSSADGVQIAQYMHIHLLYCTSTSTYTCTVPHSHRELSGQFHDRRVCL